MPGTHEYIARSLECYLPEDRQVIQAAFHLCVEEGKPYNLEFRFSTAKIKQRRMKHRRKIMKVYNEKQG